MSLEQKLWSQANVSAGKEILGTRFFWICKEYSGFFLDYSGLFKSYSGFF